MQILYYWMYLVAFVTLQIVMKYFIDALGEI